ncbi:MAG: 16S rRNA (cytosine(1402)-N(4))-methyltransferase RsmH [Bacteroidaceae bacterium]|nr:16S rRNA (cytosine(1402)-N(4))-methyltransferase RsmH [Bacteroidaceae bacterium]
MVKVAETYHVPVLLKESVDGLSVHEGTYVDMTFGGGGHSREILSRMPKNATLYGFDQDRDAEQNIIDDERFVFVRSNFRYLKNWMRYYGVDSVDGIIADLGVSSHHFDDETRGFSFRYDAPLDMRMNNRGGMTAADILNEYDEERLATVFRLYGEVKNAGNVARKIASYRVEKSLSTTQNLMQAVWGMDELTPNMKKEAARLFQALRIEVNHEMEALSEMIVSAVALLKAGGRMVVITYHSLEDRLVKNVIKAGNIEGKVVQDFFGQKQVPLKEICKVITVSDNELERNPRSRSAKLRIAEKR